MPRPNTLTLALRDLCDDIAHHIVTLAHGAFDLACVVAVAALVFASGLEQAKTTTRPEAAVQAHTVKACPLAKSDCITAQVLAPQDA